MTGPQPRASELKAKAIELRAAGLRNNEIAKHLGRSESMVCVMLKGCGIDMPGTAERTERTRIIVSAYRKGKTLQQIGDIFGVTRERIRQVLREAGIERDLGGSRLRGFVRQSELHRKILERETERIAKIEVLFGCCFDEAKRICGSEFAKAPWGAITRGKKSPGNAYLRQRQSAGKRGIGWNLTLTEWWRIWQESGHWEQRGRGKGYCMARFGDSGPYAVGNVYICTTGQNFSDSYLVHPWHERFPNGIGKNQTAERAA